MVIENFNRVSREEFVAVKESTLRAHKIDWKPFDLV